ncbi:MAG: hypothetical protein GX995_04825 [Clostridiales bacterium]|nr:hypothetical protein [Clostridiales bacterium]
MEIDQENKSRPAAQMYGNAQNVDIRTVFHQMLFMNHPMISETMFKLKVED